jgi:ketosteroid isomerase-like protein
VSRQDVERVSAAFEYFTRTGQPDLTALSEDVEIHDHDLIDAPEYSGVDGYTRWLANWVSVFAEFSIETEEFIDAGDAVVAVFRMKAVGSGSGLGVEREDAMVLHMRDAKVSRIDYYNNRREALRAAGLQEA